MSDPTGSVNGAVVALEIFTDPTGPPELIELVAEVAFDGDAYVATDDDGRYVTAGYSTRAGALRALMLEHLRTTTRPTRPRQPGEV